MPPLTDEGHYRGLITEHGVNVTRVQGLPQFVVSVVVTAQHEPADDTWNEAWADYQQVLTGYFVLVSKNKKDEIVKCLSYDQVMEATGWDGETYAGLAAMDLRGVEVQFQAQNDTYEGKTTLKMNWISAVGSSIGLKKLTGQDLTDLDAKFGGIVTPKKKAPVKATKPKATKRAAPPAPKPSVMEQPIPKPPVAEPPPTTEGQADEPDVTPCTDREAYDACMKNNAAQENPVPQTTLDDYWASNVLKYSANPEAVKNTEWPVIRNAVLLDLNIPF